MLGLALTTGSSILNAASVTFQLDATVGSVIPPSGGANMPFSIAVGDSFSGLFEFAPASGGPLYSQSGSLRFEIGGTQLHVAGYEILVADDENSGVDLNGRIADPNNTPDIDVGGTSDRIQIQCSTSLYCGTVVSHDNLMFRPTLVFANESSLLPSNDLIAEPAIWNSFSFRELSLVVIDLDSGNQTYIGAYIESVRHVPEPSTAVAGAAAFLWAGSALCRISGARNLYR